VVRDLPVELSQNIILPRLPRVVATIFPGFFH